MRALWRIREAAAGIVTRLPDGGEAWPNWEDSAVPPQHLADYLRELYDLMARHELRGIPFGHFGEGCVHVRISFDFDSEEGRRTFRTGGRPPGHPPRRQPVRRTRRRPRPLLPAA